MNVFVYGTLLSHERNNYLLANSKLLGESKVAGLEMHDLGSFPACVWTNNQDDKVVGEVWEIDEQTFHRLDVLEGYPHFYDRIEVETTHGTAWVYIYNGAQKEPFIEGGDWKEYVLEITAEEDEEGTFLP